MPSSVAEEPLGVDRVEPLAALLVRAGDAHDHRVGRPRVAVLSPAVRRRRHDLQLRHRGRALPVGGAEAVGTGVAASDDHDVLAVGVDRRVVQLAERLQVAVRQVLHGQVDPGELPARGGQVTADRGPTGEDDGVEVRTQLLGRQVAVPGAAHLHAGDEPGALGAHLVQPPVEHGLLHLELRDAVPEEATDAVGALVDGDVVPGAGELLGGGQPGGT